MVGALPGAIKELGCDVRVGLPLYRIVKETCGETRTAVRELEVPLGKDVLKCSVLETRNRDGVPVYLFEREDLFDRPNLYGTPDEGYYDNLERFAFFSRAALIFIKEFGFKPDIIHGNDWQTGLIPAYLKGLYKGDPFFKKAATVFTIHNLGYQGTFPSEKFFVTGLPSSFFSPDGIEFWGKISLLKAGIVYADAVTTVSPRYSQEIQTPEFGFGLDGVLKERRQVLHGILNGVDYMTWDPSIDEHIAKRYGPETLEGKKKCKRALLDEMGMDSALMDRPVLGMVSRLVSQKGTDLLIKKSKDLSALGIGVIVLATGERLYQDSFMEWAGKDPKRIGVRIGFDERLAHSIIAGSDILLIPSRYEPCGLTQMYAMKYGTVPLVRATGGLEDSVEQFDPETGEGTGFKFKKYDPKAFLEAIRSAVGLFGDKPSWNKLIQNCMKADFSWDRSARQYLDLYNKILRR